DPAPIAVFKRFGESSLEFELRVFIGRMDHFLGTSHDLHMAIDKAFREVGIEIAFPQRDLHVRSAKGLASLLGQSGLDIPSQGRK
ncbi:MAG TPA: mechanosensitive ion channel, partial [bacterium]|nr:mechanosensitive ion channel [bacterium]